jgi:hypothetical protein
MPSGESTKKRGRGTGLRFTGRFSVKVNAKPIAEGFNIVVELNETGTVIDGRKVQ